MEVGGHGEWGVGQDRKKWGRQYMDIFMKYGEYEPSANYVYSTKVTQ